MEDRLHDFADELRESNFYSHISVSPHGYLDVTIDVRKRGSHEIPRHIGERAIDNDLAIVAVSTKFDSDVRVWFTGLHIEETERTVIEQEISWGNQ